MSKVVKKKVAKKVAKNKLTVISDKFMKIPTCDTIYHNIRSTSGISGTKVTKCGIVVTTEDICYKSRPKKLRVCKNCQRVKN